VRTDGELTAISPRSYGDDGWTGWETLTDPVTGTQPADAAGKGAFLDYWLDQLAAEDAASKRRVPSGTLTTSKTAGSSTSPPRASPCSGW
jgi:hypothetical protein